MKSTWNKTADISGSAASSLTADRRMDCFPTPGAFVTHNAARPLSDITGGDDTLLFLLLGNLENLLFHGFDRERFDGFCSCRTSL